jgi:multisubunit Na+/H+ antiporter MnhF subunit
LLIVSRSVAPAKPKARVMGFDTTLLFLCAFIFAFGAKKETRLMVAVLIFIAIVLSVLWK